MVIHDQEKEQAWVNQRFEAEKLKESKRERMKPISVLSVQCLACGVILVLALLLKAISPNVYTQAQTLFRRYLSSNEVLTSLALWLDRDVEGEAKEGVKGDDFTHNKTHNDADLLGVSTVCLRVSQPAAAPVAHGVLTSPYGYRIHATTGEADFHRGVDIAAEEGEPIRSMYFARVIDTGENATLGRYVRLKHGEDVVVLYAHCSQIMVAQNAVVKAGETVALVGSTGDSTGPHVHIQVSVDGVVYNPTKMLVVQRYA